MKIAKEKEKVDAEKKIDLSEKNKNSTDLKKVSENLVESSEKLTIDSVDKMKKSPDVGIKLSDEELLKKYKSAIKKYISSTVGISVDLLLKDEKGTGTGTGSTIMEKDRTKDREDKCFDERFNMKDFPLMRDMQESGMKNEVEGQSKEKKDRLYPLSSFNQNKNSINADNEIIMDSPIGWRTIGESDDDDNDDNDEDSENAFSSKSTSTSISTSISKPALNASTNQNKDLSSIENMSDNWPAAIVDKNNKNDKNDKNDRNNSNISQEASSPSTLPSPPPLSSAPQSSWSSQLRKTAFAPLNYLPDLSLFPSSTQTTLRPADPPIDDTVKGADKNVSIIISLLIIYARR